jgi:ribosome-associated translation inhibitor RaiA
MSNNEHNFVTADRGGISRSAAQTSLRTPIDVLFHSEGVMPSEKLHKTVVAKISGISRRIPDAIRARVQIQRDCSSRSPRSFRAHVLYEIKGNDISAEHRGRSPHVALQGAAEKLRRQLRRRKTALLARRGAQP